MASHLDTHSTDNSAANSGLGKETEYVNTYDKSLLYPIARSNARDALNISNAQLPFTGRDLWTAWEISWLNAKGLPQVAVAEFSLPANTHSIIESKSFKLYLNSFTQTQFNSWDQVKQVLVEDLSAAAQGAVEVELLTLSEACEFFTMSDGIASTPFEFADSPAGRAIPVVYLDSIDAEVSDYQVNSSLLRLDAKQSEPTEQVLFSNLLKTNCPVTGQPDWASVWVYYQGEAIDAEGVLKYLVSMRDHQDFHEQCVENIFLDIERMCSPNKLAVYARYTRRGGLDINPFRTNVDAAELSLRPVRLVRQ